MCELHRAVANDAEEMRRNVLDVTHCTEPKCSVDVTRALVDWR